MSNLQELKRQVLTDSAERPKAAYLLAEAIAHGEWPPWEESSGAYSREAVQWSLYRIADNFREPDGWPEADKEALKLEGQMSDETKEESERHYNELVREIRESEHNPTDLDLEPIRSEDEDYDSAPPSYEIATYPADFTLEVLHQKWQASEILIQTFNDGSSGNNLSPAS